MKTIVRNIALAVAIMGLTVACTCKGNDKTEPTDSIDSTVVEEVVDSTPVEEVAEAVQAPAPKPAKKAETKKAEEPAPAPAAPKTEIKANEDGSVSIKGGKGTAIEVNKGGATVTTNDGKVKATKKR